MPIFQISFAIDHEASDVEIVEDRVEIICDIQNLNFLKEKLENKFGLPEQTEISWIPINYVDLNEEDSLSIIKFLDALDNCDDIQNVYGNFNLHKNIIENLN